MGRKTASVSLPIRKEVAMLRCRFSFIALLLVPLCARCSLSRALRSLLDEVVQGFPHILDFHLMVGLLPEHRPVGRADHEPM